MPFGYRCVFSENWEGYQKFFDWQSHMSSAVLCAIIRYCFIKKLKLGMHLRLCSWELHAKRDGYKIQTSKVSFKRVAEYILKNLFTNRKCAIT